MKRLVAVCRAATITIPPNVYVKNKDDNSLAAALKDLLGKHGLAPNADDGAIQKVKKKLTVARDLDGIDTSNIIETSGRPRRGAAAAAAVNIKPARKAAGKGFFICMVLTVSIHTTITLVQNFK